MRPIKFRAWDKIEKKMYNDIGICGKANLPEIEAEGNFFKSVSCNTLNNGIKYFQNHVKFTLMQFTGLTDKTGKPIYEGDIVNLGNTITGASGFNPGFVFDEDDAFLIQWDEEWAAWSFKYTKDGTREEVVYRNHVRALIMDGKSEIIGNIYENPELLKSE